MTGGVNRCVHMQLARPQSAIGAASWNSEVVAQPARRSAPTSAPFQRLAPASSRVMHKAQLASEDVLDRYRVQIDVLEATHVDRPPVRAISGPPERQDPTDRTEIVLRL